jgi:hypothetical protein
MSEFSLLRGVVGASLTAGIVYIAMGPEDSRWWWLTVPIVALVTTFFKEEAD